MILEVESSLLRGRGQKVYKCDGGVREGGLGFRDIKLTWGSQVSDIFATKGLECCVALSMGGIFRSEVKSEYLCVFFKALKNFPQWIEDAFTS